MTREQWDEVFAKVDNMPAEELEKIIAEAARKAGVLQTNADRIRAMSDEELAEWILLGPTIGYFAVCPPGTKDGEDCPTSPCEQCWLDWLKSPVEEVDNGT